MTVKENILITIKNKTASPKAKPPLLPILLTSLGEAASTTKNQKLRTKNYQAPSAFLKCFVRANLLSIIIRHYSLIIRNANRIYSMRYELYKKIKSIGKRYGQYGQYGQRSVAIHYLLPFIAIQGPWGRLERIDNILNLSILVLPRYGQSMDSMDRSMDSRNAIDLFSLKIGV